MSRHSMLDFYREIVFSEKSFGIDREGKWKN